MINKYDAIIVLGCVIKGETKHYDYLCASVFQSILNLSVDFKKPIGNGILTCDNYDQAIIRSDPYKKNKGKEAASACLQLLDNI